MVIYQSFLFILVVLYWFPWPFRLACRWISGSGSPWPQVPPNLALGVESKVGNWPGGFQAGEEEPRISVTYLATFLSGEGAPQNLVCVCVSRFLVLARLEQSYSTSHF